MNNSLKKQIIESLAQVIVDLDSKEKATSFLTDFIDDKDTLYYAKLLTAAHWLEKGRSEELILNNLDLEGEDLNLIKKRTKLKGFKYAVKLLDAEEWANKWLERIRKVHPSKLTSTGE